MSQPKTFMDLFAGCGGLAYGLMEAGLKPVFAVEWDERSAATYEANIGIEVTCADIGEIVDVPQVDIVVGGPPCQGFSQLGKGSLDDPRNSLWRHYFRILEMSEADVFVMENVPQLLRSGEFELLSEHARELGFDVDARIMDASEYGVPQRRLRLIMVGTRGNTVFEWPKPTHGKDSNLLPLRTVRDAIADLPIIPDGHNWHRDSSGMKEATLTMIDHVPRDGGSRFDMERSLEHAGLEHLMPRCWRNNTTGASDVFGRLWWDRPSLTIRCDPRPSKGRYIHPEARRGITPREAARLQSFPDSFVFSEDFPKVSVFHQIGNAVPPILGRVIGCALVRSSIVDS